MLPEEYDKVNRSLTKQTDAKAEGVKPAPNTLAGLPFHDAKTRRIEALTRLIEVSANDPAGRLAVRGAYKEIEAILGVEVVISRLAEVATSAAQAERNLMAPAETIPGQVR